MSNPISRRGFLRNAAIAAGAFGVSQLPGARLLGRAAAAPGDEAPVLFIFNMVGGYNALFCSADSFLGTGAFGVTQDNVRRVGTNPQTPALFVDNETFGTFADPVLAKMASVGIAHGLSGHTQARLAMLFDGNISRLVKLSSIMPSTAAVRCVAVGENPGGIHPAIGNVSMQLVRDLKTTVIALGGTTSINAPTRPPSAKAIRAAQAMAAPTLAANPTSSTSLRDTYEAAAGQLEQVVTPFNYPQLAAAYGVAAGTGGSVPTAVTSTTMQIMGCELMIHAGANVVVASQHGWDSHQDNNGRVVRDKLTGVRTADPLDNTMAALRVFTQRTMAMTNRNVVTVIMGEFSRSLPGSNHQPNLTATVIGRHVKLGTTGRVNSDVYLAPGTPGISEFWAYLAAVLRAPGKPFGNNPHTTITA